MQANSTDIMSISLGEFLQLGQEARKEIFMQLPVEKRIAFIEAFCDFDPRYITERALMEDHVDDPLTDILQSANQTKIDHARYIQHEVGNRELTPSKPQLTVIPGGKDE